MENGAELWAAARHDGVDRISREVAGPCASFQLKFCNLDRRKNQPCSKGQVLLSEKWYARTMVGALRGSGRYKR